MLLGIVLLLQLLPLIQLDLTTAAAFFTVVWKCDGIVENSPHKIDSKQPSGNIIGLAVQERISVCQAGHPTTS